MQMTLFSFFSKSLKVLAFLVAMTIGTVTINAETIEENFEDVTIVDAEGNALTSSLTPGSGLSNGWRIIGGTIYANDNGDYGLIHAAGQGFAMSDYYLTSASTSTNSAYVFIPERLQGNVLIWARSNLDERSKKTSSLKVYEATADGEVETSVLLYSASSEKGNSEWKPFQFTIDDSEGKYIALNLVYTDIDDFSATIADGSTVTTVLTVSTESIDFGTLSAEGSQSFTVKSNVTTSVSFRVTGSDSNAFEVINAPTTLAAGLEKTVEVKMNAPEPGDYQARLVITAGEQTKRITLTGTWEEKGDNPDTPDTPAEWTGEDFTGLNNIPATWTIGEDAEWTIDDWWLDSAPALKGFSGSIITPLFTIGDDQALEFYFQKGMSYGWSSKCTVSYSSDKKNWTVVESYDQYSDNGTKTIAFPQPGNYYLKLDISAISYFDDFKIVKLTSTEIGQIDNRKSVDCKCYDLQGRRMANGQWSTVNGQWSTVNGQWSTVNGQWSTVNGQLIIVNGKKVLRK